MFIQVVYQQFTFLFQRKERVTSAYRSLNFHEQERIFLLFYTETVAGHTNG